MVNETLSMEIRHEESVDERRDGLRVELQPVESCAVGVVLCVDLTHGIRGVCTCPRINVLETLVPCNHELTEAVVQE